MLAKNITIDATPHCVTRAIRIFARVIIKISANDGWMERLLIIMIELIAINRHPSDFTEHMLWTMRLIILHTRASAHDAF